MPNDLAAELLSVLPGGEWANPQPVRDRVGVMAHRSVRATATWVRRNLPVFLKCIPSRREGVGPDTALLTEPDRLEGIRLRLEQARLTSGPLVKIHRVEWIAERRWLLIAMDPIRPLSAIIEACESDSHLAIRVLRTLAIARCDGWFHFDICPGNSGVLPDGRVVFIDPESYFQLTLPRADVSLMMGKPWRMPARLQAGLGIGDSTVDVALAREKHEGEVLLLAAECCLGEYNRTAFDEHWIRDWCEASNADESMRHFWLPLLLEACTGRVPELGLVASALESLNRSPDAPSTKRSTQEIERVPDDLQKLKTWEAFEPMRRAMRERRLSGNQLEEYRDQLLKHANTEPQRREWWIELLMVYLVFAIDPQEAARIALIALQHHPDDAEIMRDRRLAERWCHHD